MALYVLRTTVGREAQVLDFLASNAKKVKGISALLFPHGMAGYILIEADNPDIIKQISLGVPYVGGVLRTPTRMEEVQHLIEFKPEEVDIHKGDVVQIIAGPFKGEKAKVTRIDVQKSQVVLELLEAAVPIPITLNLDSVKVLTKAEAAEAESEEKRDED
ncbi:MAG: transcription elongation factor Spt5 [DPANN group archaeon]|jgi:transcriptional antiterminator NusG|nr:transcription elongation factor Spt5 [DPANN group archaeon]